MRLLTYCAPGIEIDVHGGFFNDAPFFLMAGAGFDARIVTRLNYRTKRVLGRGAYTYPVIKTLAEGARLFDVELDGRRFEASWVILSFASRYGGSFVLTKDAGVGARYLDCRRDRGALAVCSRRPSAIAGAGPACPLRDATGGRSRTAGQARAYRQVVGRTDGGRWGRGGHVAGGGEGWRPARPSHRAGEICC